jgi:hypothetical protein
MTCTAGMQPPLGQHLCQKKNATCAFNASCAERSSHAGNHKSKPCCPASARSSAPSGAERGWGGTQSLKEHYALLLSKAQENVPSLNLIVRHNRRGYEVKVQVIGFDMGGTSTDVSRYDGTFEHVLESNTAGVTIQAPQLDINTVAAGGGSRLFYANGIFVVGPESSGAHPGPVCYRKNGYLSVTDANAALGRVVPEYFPRIFGPDENELLDVEGVASLCCRRW